jgi:ribonuclease Z
MRQSAVLVVIAVVAALGATVWFAGHLPRVQDAILRGVAARTLATSHAEMLGDDAIRVVLCGTGNPLPAKDRADACTAVFAGGQFYLVDAGPGAWRNIALWRLPAAKISGILLTHFHSDHIGDLGEINLQTWARGREHPLPIYGPPGVEQVVAGFSEAYKLDEGYRVAHHGAAMMPPQAWPMEAHAVAIAPQAGAEFPSGSAVVLDSNGLKITAFAVDHRPVEPAYGYRFDYKGRSVVVSGDTKPCANLVRNAAGADVLLHEAQSNRMIALIGEVAAEHGDARAAKITHDIQRYHTTPEDAAREANEAGVKLLVLSHLGPPPTNRLMRWVFMRGVSAVRSDGVRLGYDGMEIALPAGSRDIRFSSLR